MSRTELIALVQEILDGLGSLSDTELAARLERLQTSVAYPGVSDLIFWPEASFKPDRRGLPDAEALVDTILAYQPLITPLPASDRERPPLAQKQIAADE
jgi:hypothetical protein